MSSLKKRALQGAVWTVIGYGGSQTLRLGSNLILTRLLVPELFGLMALIQTFITGLNLFSDIGIRPSIIRSPRGDDPVFLNTAWTVQVIRGFGLWIACWIIAWPVAQFYNNQQLVWLLPIVGLTTVIQGFTSTSLVTLNRKVEVGKIVRLDLYIQILYIAFTVILAYFYRSIWALVLGNLFSNLARTIYSHFLDEGTKNRFVWQQESVKELVSFGRWIFVSTMMTFCAEQSDRLILGKLIPLSVFGIYTIAAVFSEMPKLVVKRITSQVMFPVISKQIHLPRVTLRNKILQKRWLVLLGLIALITCLACFGDFIILTLYDPRYHEATWMLPILAVGMWPLMLAITIDKVLFVIGKPYYVALGNTLKLLWMIIGLPLAFNSFGILGAILIVAFNDLPFYIAVNYGLWREGMTAFGQDLKATILLFSLIIGILLSRYFLGLGLPIQQLIG